MPFHPLSSARSVPYFVLFYVVGVGENVQSSHTGPFPSLSAASTALAPMLVKRLFLE